MSLECLSDDAEVGETYHPGRDSIPFDWDDWLNGSGSYHKTNVLQEGPSRRFLGWVVRWQQRPAGCQVWPVLGGGMLSCLLHEAADEVLSCSFCIPLESRLSHHLSL